PRLLEHASHELALRVATLDDVVIAARREHAGEVRQCSRMEGARDGDSASHVRIAACRALQRIPPPADDDERRAAVDLPPMPVERGALRAEIARQQGAQAQQTDAEGARV